MKRFSIKTRITIWYTSFLTLLLLMILSAMFFISDRFFLDQSRKALYQVVLETSDTLSKGIGHSNLEDISYYQNDVSIYIYDNFGRIIAPREEGRGYVNALLEHNTIKIVSEKNETWMVYDLYSTAGRTPVWIRGTCPISKNYHMILVMIGILVFASPLIIFVTALGGYFITKRAFRTIDEIRKTAEKISGGNDLSQRISDKIPAQDEVKQLALTFDHMLERLYHSFSAEKQFTSDASHELRTPTTIILAQCDYALQKAKTEEERLESIRAIKRQAKKMSTLIAQLLLLVRADNGKIFLEKETVDISELFQIVLEEMEDQAKGGHITIKTEITPEICLTGDQTLLTRLFTNLISNAIEYNKENGLIFCTLFQEDNQCVIKIRDTGIGICAEDLSKIWNRFYRGTHGKNKAGTGLGLAMVKWIVQMHQGSIDVKSEPGKGTEFIIKIPISK